MSTTIMDGTGANYRTKVAPNNRMYVQALSRTEFEEATNVGNAFNVNTEEIVLPAATGEQALFYVKNNGAQNLELVGWFIGIHNANRAGATDDTNLFRLRTNPTGGTLISDASAAFVTNRNLGSSTVFDLTAYKATGGSKTVTGFDDSAVLYQYHTAGRTFGSVSLSLPTGASLAITVDTFGAAFDLYTGFTGYVRAADE